MRTAVRLVVVGAITALGVAALGVAPASASCVSYEQNNDPAVVVLGATVYYPPLLNDVNPQDCVAAVSDRLP